MEYFLTLKISPVFSLNLYPCSYLYNMSLLMSQLDISGERQGGWESFEKKHFLSQGFFLQHCTAPKGLHRPV